MIADFIRVLRAADVRVSPAEAIDAADVIGAVGFDDRDILKYALSQCLAKTEPEKRAFDTCFDSYFTLPDMAQAPQPKPTRKQKMTQAKRRMVSKIKRRRPGSDTGRRKQPCADD